MDTGFLINISLLAIALCSIATLWYNYTVSRRAARAVDTLAGLSGLEEGGQAAAKFPAAGQLQGSQFNQLDIDEINDAAEHFTSVSEEEFWTEQFFRAGLFTKQQRNNFQLFRIISLIAFPVLFLFLFGMVDFYLAILAGVIGLLIGWRLPYIVLERKIKNRDYEILYHLPLEIEQLVIGVSSSLDIGPCIQNVVQMADERDCHNPVTELFRYVQHYVKAGASLESAILEVGKLSCHTELKHAFMALAQVSRHGGEITKQLQQLADAVSKLRETQIDAKIKRLELEATGPVALVFLAFMGILLVGLGTQIAMIFQQ